VNVARGLRPPTLNIITGPVLALHVRAHFDVELREFQGARSLGHDAGLSHQARRRNTIGVADFGVTFTC
jgi:hypothetical protein